MCIDPSQPIQTMSFTILGASEAEITSSGFTSVTFFGVTNTVSPTIIEEYSAVRSLVESGTITREECMALVGSLASPDSREEITRVTLFRGCGIEPVSEKKQRKARGR